MYRGGIRLKGKSVDMNRRLDCSLEEQLSWPIRVRWAPFSPAARTVFFPVFPFSFVFFLRFFFFFFFFFLYQDHQTQINAGDSLLFTALAFPMCVSRLNWSHLKPSSRGLTSNPWNVDDLIDGTYHFFFPFLCFLVSLFYVVLRYLGTSVQ